MQVIAKARAIGLAVAVLVPLLTACTSSTGSTRSISATTSTSVTSASGSATASDALGGSTVVSVAGWATVSIPRQWHVTPFRGEPAPVYFPLDFVSTEKLPPMCPGEITQSCAARNWFATGWAAPVGGVTVLWSHVEIPTGPTISNIDGRAATIDGRPAKVRSGAATSACLPGTATELDAYVSTSAQTGERFDMKACFGPHATRNDRASVIAMLNSLHRKYRT
jgi:hypothetical protein